MAADQERVSRLLSSLSHPIRREILFLLSEKGELSFTELMNAINIDTGKLSFHIRALTGLLEQTSTSKYRLSKLGENAIVIIRDLEVWAVEMGTTAKFPDVPLANFKKRTVAFLIDLAITVPTFVVTAVLTNVFSFLTGAGGFRLDADLILFLILFWFYLTLLEGFSGQSLGKRILGLKVVRQDGRNPSYDHAAIRNFGKVFLLPFDLLVGSRLHDKRYIRYFDRFAGTMVLDLRS